MGERSSYPPGTFCWVDLASNDVEAATAFYGELFGWSARSDASAGMPYTTFHRDGHAVCGLYAMDTAMRERGTPPFWQSYVRVDSADQVTAQARALGAGIFVEPMDMPGAGRMAVIQDTGAAVFGIWEPHGHPGATLVNEPGSLCWNELQTHDAEGAGMFYEQLFGWALEALPGEQEPPYFNFRHHGRLAGGMLPLRPEVALLPNWAVYFAVEDCEAAAATVERLGGRLVLPPREVTDLGAFAVAQDPGGALFSVIRLHHPDP
jgi:hypothetical protein